MLIQQLMNKFALNGNKFTPGQVRPIDQNGDNKIDANNDRVIIGNTRPRWIVGMTNGFTYKNLNCHSLYMAFKLLCLIQVVRRQTARGNQRQIRLLDRK